MSVETKTYNKEVGFKERTSYDMCTHQMLKPVLVLR